MKHLLSLLGVSPKFQARFKHLQHKVISHLAHKTHGGAVGHRMIDSEDEGGGVKHRKRHSALKFRM